MNAWKQIILLFMLFPLFNDVHAAEGIDGKEIIGFRIGSLLSSNKLNDAFGKGSELEFHFVEGLGTSYGLDISLSSHNFGESKLPDKDTEYVSTGEPLELQIYSLTAAIFACYRLTNRITATADSGIGLYSITLIRPIGILEQRLTDYQPGVYGSLGLLYRLTENGFYININAKYNYISSGGDNKIDHPLLFYTGEKRT
ncbi:hypothetical protein J7M07_04770, partial [bacterium]|nr:hypothetical protein [bacterium]